MNITLLSIWLDIETFTLVVPLSRSVSKLVLLLVTASFKNQVYLSGPDPLADRTENMYLSPFMLTLIPSARAGSEKWQINYTYT